MNHPPPESSSLAECNRTTIAADHAAPAASPATESSPAGVSDSAPGPHADPNVHERAAPGRLSLRLRLMFLLLAVFGFIQVALSIVRVAYVQNNPHPMSELRWHTSITTPLGLAATAFAGWVIAGIAVRPIERLRRAAASIRPETIQQPIDFGGGNSPELARLQSELDHMRQRLETGYEAQARFVANVSHEVKTPIATVLTEAQTLSRSLSMPDEARRFVDSTQDEMRRLGRLVESFLMLTRVRHGKPLQSTARTVSINDIALDSLQHCYKTAEQHGVLFKSTLSEDDVDALILRGDPELLRTMVDNLLRNAIRFSQRGDLVELSVSLHPTDLQICVNDRGPGIPPELVHRMFDRFSQAQSEEKLGRGSGLGLEIAQGIAELHGGRITVSNRDGGGCSFCVTFPRLVPSPL